MWPFWKNYRAVSNQLNDKKENFKWTKIWIGKNKTIQRWLYLFIYIFINERRKKDVNKRWEYSEWLWTRNVYAVDQWWLRKTNINDEPTKLCIFTWIYSMSFMRIVFYFLFLFEGGNIFKWKFACYSLYVNVLVLLYMCNKYTFIGHIWLRTTKNKNVAIFITSHYTWNENQTGSFY